jgi:hypothetical protein
MRIPFANPSRGGVARAEVKRIRVSRHLGGREIALTILLSLLLG